jgi:hypothetical protein
MMTPMGGPSRRKQRPELRAQAAADHCYVEGVFEVDGLVLDLHCPAFSSAIRPVLQRGRYLTYRSSMKNGEGHCMRLSPLSV